MPAAPSTSETLRALVAGLEGHTPCPAPDRTFRLGHAGLDDDLAGGLSRAAVHEVFGAGDAHLSAASGYALALCQRACIAHGPLLWVRHTALEVELGRPYPPGLSALGLDPADIVFVRAKTVEAALRACGEGALCGGLGGVLLELWGEDKRIDLTTSRRLTLRTESAATPIIMLRAHAAPSPSAAATRWLVRASRSRPLPANAPGAPAFEVTLERWRGGAAGQTWRVEWSPHERRFLHAERVEATTRRDAAPSLPGAVAAFPRHRPRTAPPRRMVG